MTTEPKAKVATKREIPPLAPGDTVKVSAKIIEGEKERVQVFEGVIIRLKQGGIGSTFTVRRIAHGVGVERTFPVHSPLLEKVEVVRHGQVRRAKLYYLRGLSAKRARIKERRVERGEESLEPQEAIEVQETPEAPKAPVAPETPKAAAAPEAPKAAGTQEAPKAE